MSSNIVDRLKNASYENAPSRCFEAAAEIARLTAALSRAEKALVEVSILVDEYDPNNSDWRFRRRVIARVMDAAALSSISEPVK